MNLNNRAVQTHRFNLDADELLALQLSEQPIEHSSLGPAVHARVDRMPIAESLRQRAPLAAGLGHVKDGVNHVEVLVRDIPALTRQVLLDASKLCSVNFHSTSVSNMCASVNRP